MKMIEFVHDHGPRESPRLSVNCWFCPWWYRGFCVFPLGCTLPCFYSEQIIYKHQCLLFLMLKVVLFAKSTCIFFHDFTCIARSLLPTSDMLIKVHIACFSHDTDLINDRDIQEHFRMDNIPLFLQWNVICHDVYFTYGILASINLVNIRPTNCFFRILKVEYTQFKSKVGLRP
jgi:hypothetical protein